MSIQVNDKNLGHATAYAYAVAGGYTGTEAAFTELLGNIADDLGQIENLTVTVETLAAGSSATASYSNGVLHLGIPKGDKGDKGDTGATGPTGPTGNGIASVAKTGTSGLVDTYTITYTNGNTSTFTVTNGAEAVDNTLTIAGRAADAKKTGDEISELKEDLNAITKEKSDVIDFDSEEIGKAYNIDNTGGVSWSGANSFIKQVDEGDNYKISTTIIKNTKYYAVLCYTDTTFVSGIYQGSSLENIVLTDYDFVIPSGINKIIVTAPKNVTPTLKSIEKTVDVQTFPNNYVDFDGTTLKIKARYNNTEDIVVQMQKRGNNNLFDFDRLFTVAKSEELNGDFTELRSILLSNTDCFSPHQVRARENIDGDSTAYFLTGGNHNHENISTAYCDNLHVFVDESEVSTFSGVCNSIRVTWENHIQGHNTWKADGTGRSVLDELIELQIVGSTFDVVVKQIPTENIYQSVYYGIQSINTPYTTVRFVGGTNRASIPINSSANSGSHNCRRTIAINTTTGDCLETKVLDEDLGTFDYTGATYSAFTANNKLYYAVMRDQTVAMNEGELWCLFGRYRFYSDKV